MEGLKHALCRIFDHYEWSEHQKNKRILTDKPGGRLYKVRWKGIAASRVFTSPSSFVPRYTTVWLDYLKKKGISVDVKDVLVHLIMHERN